MTRTDDQNGVMTPLEREAVDWVVRLHSGGATVSDARALALWRSQSSEHERAFRDAVVIRRGMKAMLKRSVESNVTRLSRREGALSRRAVLTGSGGAIAASAAGVWVATRPPLDLWPSLAELMADYRTGVGERRTVHPAAGVDIEMSTRTSIARTDGGEGVDLVKGEAFFVIDRAHPFQTTAGGGAISATRASFDLRHINDEICAVCVAGRAVVRRGSSEAALSAGQQVVFSRDRFGQVSTADAAGAVAWRSGLLVFRGEPLIRVLDEVNRYLPGRIILTDQSLRRYPVNAVFHLDQMGNAVTQVEQLVGRRGTALPGGVTLIG